MDSRSHRLSRVCRSTSAADPLGGEEGMDARMFCRGLLAIVFSVEEKMCDEILEAVPYVQVTICLWGKGHG